MENGSTYNGLLLQDCSLQITLFPELSCYQQSHLQAHSVYHSRLSLPGHPGFICPLSLSSLRPPPFQPCPAPLQVLALSMSMAAVLMQADPYIDVSLPFRATQTPTGGP